MKGKILTELTDDTRHIFRNLALASYTGEKCTYCKQEYKSVKDIEEKDPVWVAKLPNGEENKDGRLCCKDCFPEYSETKQPKEGVER